MISAVTKMIDSHHVITVSNLRIDSSMYDVGWLYFDLQIDGETRKNVRERCGIFRKRNYGASILLGENLEIGAVIFEILRENISNLEIKTFNPRDILHKFFMTARDPIAVIKTEARTFKFYSFRDLKEFFHLRIGRKIKPKYSVLFLTARIRLLLISLYPELPMKFITFL
jgi:hypothetical protein